MTSSTQSLTTQLPDVLDELREAQQFFSVWRAFTNAENQAVFEPTMRRYPQFFDSVVRAHLAALIVALYRLYEGGSKTRSLRRLYEDTKSLNIFEQKIIESASELDYSIRDIWKKVCILRTNVFGHKSAKLCSEKAFEKAELTPDELATMIKRAQRLFNCISRTLTHSAHAFNTSATRDVSNLMTRLGRNAL